MTEQSEAKPIQCHNCGHDNLATAKICLVCDSPLTYTSRFQKTQKKPTGLLPPTEEESYQAKLEEEQKLVEKAKQTYQAELAEQRARPTAIKMTSSSLKERAICLDCGYMNLVGDLFCLECGAGLALAPKKESPADITLSIKDKNVSQIQAAVAKQKASATVGSEPAQSNIAKPELKSVDDNVLSDGFFQFTSEMRLRFTEIETGRYIEATPSKDKPLLVGRIHESLPIQPEVDLTPFLMEQHGVSRRHALIRLRDLRLKIQDLNSTNGTGINGFRFQPKEAHQIRNGDIVTLGRVSMKVSFLREDGLRKDTVTEKLIG